jgi:hypothetical protein
MPWRTDWRLREIAPSSARAAAEKRPWPTKVSESWEWTLLCLPVSRPSAKCGPVRASVLLTIALRRRPTSRVADFSRLSRLDSGTFRRPRSTAQDFGEFRQNLVYGRARWATTPDAPLVID